MTPKNATEAPRLLIVDDDTVIAETLQHIAVGKGFDVNCVHDSSKILANVAAFNPHVIFLDLIMPGIDGVEVIGILGDNHCTAKIVLLSGMDKRAMAMVGSVVEEKQLELLGSISKPPKIEEIDAILLPLAAEIEARESAEPEATAPFRFGLQLRVQAHRFLRESHEGDLAWITVSLDWMPDNGIPMPIENALTEDVRMNSARGIFSSMLRLCEELVSTESNSGKNQGICLPLSNALLSDVDLPNFIAGQVELSSLIPKQLMLEIDESEILGVGTSKQDILSRLKIKGFGIAVTVRNQADQLLSCINSLAFDEVVIDMSCGLDSKSRLSDSETEFQYSSLVSMVNKAGAITSAKNVDSAEQVEFVKRCGFAKTMGGFL